MFLLTVTPDTREPAAPLASKKSFAIRWKVLSVNVTLVAPPVASFASISSPA